MRRLIAGLFAVALTLPLSGGPAVAQGHDREHERERREHRGEGWHGDIHRFHEHDFDHWRGGHWYHGMHDGRLGWWWTVGPTWYFYSAPVYPYPDPYVPPVAVAPPPGPQQYWYYCRNPQGYYPYVPQCFGNWEAVPAG